MTKMISLKDAASLLGVKPGTLQDWVARKDIICYRYPRPTSRPRFKPEDIAFINLHLEKQIFLFMQ